MNKPYTSALKTTLIAALFFIQSNSQAQTLNDGIYMYKNKFCAGVMYTHDQWKNYWEGTLKRDNENLGKVSNSNITAMVNYGITNKLNVIASLPYVWTKASAGTLSGMSGVQDLTMGVKYKAIETELGKGKFSLHAIGGFTTPVSNYVADFLPMSIGIQSKTAFGKAMLQYLLPNNLFVSVNGSYTARKNITIDRESYYAGDQLINSNEVALPNLIGIHARAGYYINRWGAVAIYEQMNSTSGFDIRRNDMPFPSNKMNVKRIGVWGSYRIKQAGDLQLLFTLMQTIAGRNMGQSTTMMFGVAQILNFSKPEVKK